MNNTNHQKFVNNIILEKESTLTKTSEYIWSHPETRFEEYLSSGKLLEVLEAEGFAIEQNLGGIQTAFKGEYGNGKPVIGFLGEFDALSGLSQKPLIDEEQSIDGQINGHGCGHNLLGVGSLGAAIATKAYLKSHNLPGTVIYYGCPGEEGGSGKTFMSREGVFDSLDYAFCWHPSPANAIMSNKSLANFQIYFRFKGISSHAANSPELGRSALDAVELMNVGVNYLREHMPDTNRIHYAVTNTGGISPNVVQANAEVLYLIRAENLKGANELLERVRNIAQGAALMTGTECEIEIDKACSDYSPNRKMEEIMYHYLKEEESEIVYSENELNFAENIWQSLTQAEKDNAQNMLQSFGVISDSNKLDHQRLSRIVNDYVISDKPMMGSTDVADVSWVAPTAQCTCTTEAMGTPLHTWQMVSQGTSTYAFKGMFRAARIMANTALHILKDENLLKSIQKEHKEKLEKHPYKNPIPDHVQPSTL